MKIPPDLRADTWYQTTLILVTPGQTAWSARYKSAFGAVLHVISHTTAETDDHSGQFSHSNAILTGLWG